MRIKREETKPSSQWRERKEGKKERSNQKRKPSSAFCLPACLSFLFFFFFLATLFEQHVKNGVTYGPRPSALNNGNPGSFWIERLKESACFPSTQSPSGIPEKHQR
jgi:hypothetical protein